jgi:hypothetical protein
MTPGCTATAEDEVYSSRISPSGSELPSDNLTINTASEAARMGQQAPIGGNTDPQAMLTASGPMTEDESHWEEALMQTEEWRCVVAGVDDYGLFGEHVP